jgi:hypothetical protein
VPSVKRDRRLVLLALAGVFAAGSLGGCSTTQDKAAAHRAESERILKARDKSQARQGNGTKSQTPHADGTKSQAPGDKSARRRGSLDESARGGRKEMG